MKDLKQSSCHINKHGYRKVEGHPEGTLRLRPSVTFSIADEHVGEREQKSVLTLPDVVGMGGSKHFIEK